jgi:hypothetical protein
MNGQMNGKMNGLMLRLMKVQGIPGPAAKGCVLLFGQLLAGFAFANLTSEPLAVYRVEPSRDLSSIVVEARFEGAVSPLRARDGSSRRLGDLEDCEENPISHSDNRIPVAAGGCLRYRYPLVPREGRRSPPVADGVVVTAPSEWLWVPRLEDGQSVRIELSLPDTVAASVPWRKIGADTYELARSPGSSTGSAIFGPIEVLDLALGETRLSVALVDGPDLTLDRETMRSWLEAAAGDVAAVAGRFPNPDLQVVVQPVRSRGRSPVPFGYVIRDGGEAVRFFVDPQRSLDDLLDDWTATHEFSHLLLPYVRSREKWVSEGFASYYQNVLLARRGAYDESEVWQRLHRSFSIADDVRDPPALRDLHERPFWETRMLVYWSGAAMALLADTRLREASGGRESLDTVLGRLQRCCLPSGRVWRAGELFETLDGLTDYPVFVDLFARLSRERGMPDLEPLYADLGIEVSGEAVVLRDGRLEDVRRAIMGK